MDIKLNIKGLSVIRGQIKVEDIDFGVSGTSEEVINANESILELIDNPAVQRLINKFTEEVSFKPVSHEPSQPQQKTAANITELCGKVNEALTVLKKEREANARAHQVEQQILNKFNHLIEIAERMQKF